MTRWLRAALSACLLFAVYWLYAAFVVPYLEPTASYRRGIVVASDDISSTKLDLTQFFDEKDWQRSQRCKTIETSRGVLLFEKFDRQANGAIELTPVTLILRQPSRDAGDLVEEDSHPLILDAPQGAELRSESELNLARMQFGKIVGGQLKGPVTIRTVDSAPPEKRLHLTTRDVQLDGNRIWTPHSVRFSYGASSGSGSNLVITTADKTSDASGVSGESSFGEIKSVELVQLDRLLVHLKDAKMFPFGGQDKTAGPTASMPTIVEITCRGPFIYDLANLKASFEDHVQALRVNPHGPPDRLRCRLLGLAFQKSGADERALNPSIGKATVLSDETPPPHSTKASSGETSLDAVRTLKLLSMTASGSPNQPVMLESPSQKAAARGSRLHYDGASRTLMIEQPGNALLQHDLQVIRSPRIEYELAEDPEQLGKLWAQGPGSIQGVLEGKNPHPFTASWQRLLQLEPRDQHHVFSFYDRVHLSIRDDEIGQFDAERVHLYVKETPFKKANGKTAYEVTPLRMRALDGVSFDSPQLSGSTAELNVFFELPQTNLPGDAGQGPPALSTPILEAPERTSPDEKAPTRKFHVSGGQMELRVITPVVGPPALDDVTVANRVVVEQTKLDDKDRGPLNINGDVLQISSVSRDQNRITVKGRPALVAIGPMSIQGAEVVFDQQGNKATVDGEGQMTFPASRLDPHRLTQVNWKDGMDFDGLIARFRGQVVADGSRLDKKQRLMRYHAEAGYMAATINQRVDFRDVDKNAKNLELAHMKFDAGVYFENQTFSEPGQMASHEKLQSNNLNVDQIDGRLAIEGPGWASTARFSKDRFQRVDERDSNSTFVRKKAPRLTFLHVKFEEGVRGNILDKNAKFLGGVVAVHGPITDWGQTLNPNIRGGLGPRGMELRTEQLNVVDVSTTKKPIIELVAIGNTIVESEKYGASAQRLTFTESKSLLVLDGDSTYDAKLKVFGPNPKSAVAKRIKFWTDTYDFDVDRVQSIQLGTFGKGPSRPPKPIRPGSLR